MPARCQLRPCTPPLDAGGHPHRPHWHSSQAAMAEGSFEPLSPPCRADNGHMAPPATPPSVVQPGAAYCPGFPQARPGPALPCHAPARPLACCPNPGAVWTPSGLHCAQPNVNPAISPGPTRRLGRLLRLPAIQAASVPSRPWRTVSSRLLSPLSPYSYPAVGGGRQHRGPSTGSLARQWGRRVLPRALST